MDFESIVAELSEYGRLAIERGLVVGRMGNISARLGDDEFLISRRGGRLDCIGPADLARCSITGSQCQGEARPSTETPMHRAIYRAQPEARAILHSSPFYTTLVACSDIELRLDIFPEAMAYTANIGRVPYLHPGTDELAQAAAAEAAHNVIILDNHGLLVWGQNLEETVQLSEMMERLCQMMTFARLGEGAFHLRYLGPDLRRDFEERVLYGRERG
jgi:L-fuculose-phosphate aldolase